MLSDHAKTTSYEFEGYLRSGRVRRLFKSGRVRRLFKKGSIAFRSDYDLISYSISLYQLANTGKTVLVYGAHGNPYYPCVIVMGYTDTPYHTLDALTVSVYSLLYT